MCVKQPCEDTYCTIIFLVQGRPAENLWVVRNRRNPMSTIMVGIYFEPSKRGDQRKDIFVNSCKTKQSSGPGVSKGF